MGRLLNESGLVKNLRNKTVFQNCIPAIVQILNEKRCWKKNFPTHVRDFSPFSTIKKNISSLPRKYSIWDKINQNCEIGIWFGWHFSFSNTCALLLWQLRCIACFIIPIMWQCRFSFRINTTLDGNLAFTNIGNINKHIYTLWAIKINRN